MNRCPLVDWYVFNRCQVKTCKYFSEKLKSRCIKLERIEAEGYKNISDAELMYYKFNDTSLKEVAKIRKKAVVRVRSILVLYRFVLYIKDNYESFCDLSKYPSKRIDQLLSRYPFSVPELGVEPWTLFYIFDPSVFYRFSNDNKDGDMKNIGHETLVSMSKREFYSTKNFLEEEKLKCNQSQSPTLSETTALVSG